MALVVFVVFVVFVVPVCWCEIVVIVCYGDSVVGGVCVLVWDVCCGDCVLWWWCGGDCVLVWDVCWCGMCVVAIVWWVVFVVTACWCGVFVVW